MAAICLALGQTALRLPAALQLGLAAEHYRSN